ARGGQSACRKEPIGRDGIDEPLAIRRNWRTASASSVHGGRIQGSLRRLHESRNGYGQTGTRPGDGRVRAVRRFGTKNRPSRLPRTDRSEVRQLLRRARPHTGKERLRGPIGRWLFDVARDLRAEPERVRTCDLERVRNELRPPAAG